MSMIALAAAATDDGSDVRPGWIPLIIVLILGAFIAFLYFSMKKQLGRIDIPEGGVPTKPGADDAGSTPPAEQG
jgi:hypothetical protein